MANPQLENGYIRIASELFDALMRVSIPPASRCVFDAIIRKTYGFNKKKDVIPISQLMSMTGIPRSNVCRALDRLKHDGMIQRNEKSVTGIVKDWEKWKIERREIGMKQMKMKLCINPKGVVSNLRQTSLKIETSASLKIETLNRHNKQLQKTMPKSVDNIIQNALTLTTDSEEWDDVLSELATYGYHPRLDGDVAIFREGRWRVKGASGWIDWSLSTKNHLTFMNKEKAYEART